jgi:hypothetical protein
MTEKQDTALDQALEFTFPASDPVAVGGITGYEVAEERIGQKEMSDKSWPLKSAGATPKATRIVPAVAPILTKSLLAILFFALTALTSSRHVLADDATVIRSDRAQHLASVLGVEVRSAGRAVGRIVDLLARPDGSVEAAVIEYGGFLGIGSRKVAVGWSHLHFETKGTQLYAVTDLAPDEMASSSEY